MLSLSLNNLLIVIEIHEKIVNKVNRERLHCCTPQTFQVFTIILTLLVACLDCVPLEAQINIVELTKLRFMGICRGMESVANHIPLGRLRQCMLQSRTCMAEGLAIKFVCTEFCSHQFRNTDLLKKKVKTGSLHFHKQKVVFSGSTLRLHATTSHVNKMFTG